MEKNWIPANAHTITPYLIIEEVPKCIAFLEATFGAKLDGKLNRPNGSLMHAEVMIGDSLMMLGEPMGEFGTKPATMFVYVEDAQAIYDRALANGGKFVMEMMDQPHAGVKYGGIEGPCGNIWWIGTKIEDISWEDQQQRVNSTAHLWSTDEI